MNDAMQDPSMMDSREYGMPITEDADNLPTMAQLHLNFNISQSNQANESQRSGVFGGLNASNADVSQTPSFMPQQMSFQQNTMNVAMSSGYGQGANPQLVSNQNLQRLATQQIDSPETLVQSKYAMPAAANSPDGRMIHQQYSDEQLRIQYAEEDEELQVNDPLQFDDGAIDQDFDFIEDDIGVYMSEM